MGIVDKMNELVDSIKGFFEQISTVFGFLDDPFGFTAEKLKEACLGFATKILPVFTEALKPDLSADWVVSSYRISFAVAVMILVLLLIWMLVRGAMSRVAPRDVLDSFLVQAPLFVIGSAFGPPLGWLLTQFFGKLSDVFMAWGVNRSSAKTIDTLSATIKNVDVSGIAGGAIMAIILLFGMLIGLFFCMVVLIVQLVAVYLGWIVIPLALVWRVDPQKKKWAMKLPVMWVGFLGMHALMFFMLGSAFNFMAEIGSQFNDENWKALKTLMELLVSMIVLWIAALSPLLLVKFAPVIPTEAGQGQGPSGGPIGAKDQKEAQQQAQQDNGSSDADSDASNDEDNTSNVMRQAAQQEDQKTGNPMASSGGKTMADAGGEKGATGGGDASESGAGAGGKAGSGSGGKAASGSGSKAGGKAGAGAAEGPGAQAASGASGGAATGATSSAGAAGGAAGAAGGAEGAAAGTAALGAGESATGVGAVVGIPTMVAAAGVAVAGEAAEMAGEALEEGAGQAVDAVDVDENQNKRH
ncbi:hypothetical protein [Brevibacterium aurantiacum]|uniref:hypothetical protein n=1 Tax=Brevibacterium aurantiacum TaxID=273384 RepID=UPI0018670CAF|nr:hypothetical protein [Brevibacterium aurantiacum]